MPIALDIARDDGGLAIKLVEYSLFMDRVSLDTSGRPLTDRLTPPAPGRALSSRVGGLAPILILAAAAIAAHGRGLTDGLFLDDHLHVLGYQDHDWSLSHLLNTTTIVPRNFMETWWQDKAFQWQYARPVSVLLAKAVYHLSGGSVKTLHVLSLLMHWATAVMVFRLCLLLTRREGWSLIGGLLFVVHSHSIYAVGWLAAQNCVLQTMLTLAALLAYIRASGLDVYAGGTNSTLGREPAPLAKAWLLPALGCWLLGLLSRENALVFPVFAVAFDLAFGGRRWVKRRVPMYLLMGVVAVGFAFWRMKFFYHPMPDFYVRTYDGPEYLLWWLAKLLHYITGVIWLSPLMVGPSARLNPFREVPGDCLLMLGIIGVLAIGYVLTCRRVRGWWIWPLWILLALLPVIPVFAAPHSAYMPAVGFAVALVLCPALRREVRPGWLGRLSSGVAIWFLAATATYMPIYRLFWVSVQTAERMTITQMAADPPLPPVKDVFLINLPLVNIYTRLHLAEALAVGRDGASVGDDFRCHVLTYSPDVLRMDQKCELEQVDGYTFRLTIGGRGYFSGALGRFLIEAMRSAGKFETGQVIKGEQFDVEIQRANQEGVQQLQFRFREPLASPRYCFYWATNRASAARVHFCRPGSQAVGLPDVGGITMTEVQAAASCLKAGKAGAGMTLLAASGSNDVQIRGRAMTGFRHVAVPICRAIDSPIEMVLLKGDWSEGDRAFLAQWWGTSVDDRTLDALWVWSDEWELMREKRDALYAFRRHAAAVIKTDLYMTGPPFPGPR